MPEESEAESHFLNIPNLQIFQSDAASMGSQSPVAEPEAIPGPVFQSGTFPFQVTYSSFLAAENPPVSPYNTSNSGSSDWGESRSFGDTSRKRKQTDSKQEDTGGKRKRGQNPPKKSCSKEDEEKKKAQNRKYAHTSRLKKANEMKQLKQEKTQQESIIEIYKKVLNIFHMRLHGTNIRWKLCKKEWFPSQATRNSPPLVVECLLPDNDEELLNELGNSAYGTLFTSATAEGNPLSNGFTDVKHNTHKSSVADPLLQTVDRTVMDNNSFPPTILMPGPSASPDTYPSTSLARTNQRTSHLPSSAQISVSSAQTNAMPVILKQEPADTVSAPEITANTSAQFNSLPVKVESLNAKDLPHASASGKNPEKATFAPVSDTDLVNILTQAICTTSTGQRVNIVYVMPDTKQPQRNVQVSPGKQIITAWGESPGAELIHTDSDSRELKRVTGKTDGLILKQEPAKNISASLTDSGSSARSYYQTSVAGHPDVHSQRLISEDQVKKNLNRAMEIVKQQENGDRWKSKTMLANNPPRNESTAEETNKFVQNYPCLNTALNLSTSKRGSDMIKTGVRPQDAQMVESSSGSSTNGNVKPTCKTQFAGAPTRGNIQQVAAPVSSFPQYRHDTSETHMHNTHFFSSLSHLPMSLNSSTQSTNDHAPPKGNFNIEVKNGRTKLQPQLSGMYTVVSSGQHSSQNLAASQARLLKIPSAPVPTPLLLPQSVKHETQQIFTSNAIDVESKSPTTPDESPIYGHVHSSSGLGSLSAFIIDDDGAELENLKPTFPNQT